MSEYSSRRQAADFNEVREEGASFQRLAEVTIINNDELPHLWPKERYRIISEKAQILGGQMTRKIHGIETGDKPLNERKQVRIEVGLNRQVYVEDWHSELAETDSRVKIKKIGQRAVSALLELVPSKAKGRHEA